jgi:aminopeptidase N
MRDDAATAIQLRDYRPNAFAIDEIALTFDLLANKTRVHARSSIRRIGGGGEPLVLNGIGLTLERIAVNNEALDGDSYSLSATHLTLHNAPDVFTLEVETLIDPGANTALEGLYMSGGRFCTQCEAEGFRKITYALDRPDSLSRFWVRIEADKFAFPTLLSNGDPIEAGDLDQGRHFAVWRDPHPKPTYLFALVAGAFDTIHDTFTTGSGKRVSLAIHVDLGEAEKAHYAMDALKRCMAWDEDVFGREYDLSVFNIVAVRDFNFGAMENKGLNIFNAAYILADAQTATDADFEAIESVVAHEYFHNWTGNRITLRDWFQLCLKEGLTVYRDQEFTADQRSRLVKRIKDVRMLRARQFTEDAGPLAHPVRPTAYAKIDNFYTATVYEKGAEVIRMLQRLIGADAFARGMSLYFDRCDGTAATVEDFIACFQETSGRDLSPFMAWYNYSGTPAVSVERRFDAESGVLELTLSQSNPRNAGALATIPLEIGFVSEDGAILSTRLGENAGDAISHAVTFETAQKILHFSGLTAAPIPALLRGFSAPVTLKLDLTSRELLIQMAHDPDPFTRWEAGQTLYREAILPEQPPSDGDLDRLADALRGELARAAHDPAFTALALRAPDLNELLQATPTPDPDAIHARRHALRAGLAQRLRAALEAIVEQPRHEPFSPAPRHAAQRSLKSAAIDLLAALNLEDLIAAQFDHAQTMTERMATLEALGQIEGPGFDLALHTFYERWREEALVIDKWFSVQASAPRLNTLARVKALSAHPDFSLRNPNRARALIASFAMRNPLAFHAADGQGYAYVAEMAGRADALNPALAARLLTAFENWRRFDPGRQAKAKAALTHLQDQAGLSANARDVIARALA